MKPTRLVKDVLPSAIARTRCPLDPDAYLSWLWWSCGGKGRAMTAHQWWLAFQRHASLTEGEGRKALVHLAAHIRRRQRLQLMAARNGSVLAP